jgi:anaerobic magnesium-protoporphyrin IX monomethyl ester cyclase
LGYNLKLLFVVGTPGETWEDVEDDVRLALKYPLQDVHFYNIIPFPGTELFEWVKKNNRFLLEPEYYLNEVTFNEIRPIFDTPELSKEDRLRLFKYLEGVRKEVHRRAVQRMFKNVPLVGKLAKGIVSTDLFLKLFYQSFAIRRFIDARRYKRAIRNSPD